MSCFLLDPYVEEEGSRCLRRQKRYGDEIVMTRLDAMDECSKNKRCVGIEFAQLVGNVARLFKLCLD